MIKEADIVLIYPKTGMDFGSTVAPPHNLLAIAAPLHKEGYKVKIIDQRVESDWKGELEGALESKPICVGISSMTGTQIYFALEAAKFVRAKTDGKIPLIWGGPHPSILPEQTLKSDFADIVCIGEADETFYKLVKALQARHSISNIEGIAYKEGDSIHITKDAPLIDIETLLAVPWELVDVEKYVHPDMYLKESPRTLDIGQTSRGCPFNCGFCCSASLRKRKWRAMSAEKSLNNIVSLVKKFNLNGIWIRDDEFYIDRQRANKICEGMIRENLNINWYTSGTRVDIFNKATEEDIALLKRSGAYVVKIGAESGTNRILKLINKGITVEETIKANLKAKRHGIKPTFALMIAFPTETLDEIQKTIELAFRLKKDNPRAMFETMAIYTALPGTPMYNLALEHGLKPPQNLEGWINWNFDEYDLEGKRIPWFNYNERQKLGNICYMSILANAVPNVINSIDNIFLKNILKVLYFPVSRYYKFRLKRGFYGFSLDLKLIRFLRKKIFYRSYVILK